MNTRRRTRFWAESVLAAISAVLAVVAVFRPRWIEGLFDVSPDNGSGATEWWLVAVFVVAAAVLTVAATIEFRQVAPAS